MDVYSMRMETMRRADCRGLRMLQKAAWATMTSVAGMTNLACSEASTAEAVGVSGWETHAAEQDMF